MAGPPGGRVPPVRRPVVAPAHAGARGRLAVGMAAAVILHVAVFMALTSGYLAHVLETSPSPETVIGRLVDDLARTLEAGEVGQGQRGLGPSAG